MSKDDATITIDMDRTCTVCHRPGAMPNGLCMGCAVKRRLKGGKRQGSGIGAGAVRGGERDDEILEESLTALEDERAALSARVLVLEQLYDQVACHVHCACQREPGDCCAIGSVIGGWDKRYTEQWEELEAIQAERDALRAALLATRCGDVDGPCWCICDDDDDEHGAACLQARAALGVATTQAGVATTQGQASRRHPSCASADAPLGCEDCSPEPAP